MSAKPIGQVDAEFDRELGASLAEKILKLA